MNARRAITAVGALLLLAIVAGVAWQRMHPLLPRAEYAPDFRNDKLLYAGGWSGDEVRKILEDFRTLYGAQLPPDFEYNIATGYGVQRVNFPRDISPWMFLFLVNYATYPKDLDPKGRPILVAGTTTMSPDFKLPSQSLYGRKATVYVPAGDKDYGSVYLRIEGAATWKIPLEDGPWEVVNDPHAPDNLDTLTRS